LKNDVLFIDLIIIEVLERMRVVVRKNEIRCGFLSAVYTKDRKFTEVNVAHIGNMASQGEPTHQLKEFLQ
jgi:hypothetical protein